MITLPFHRLCGLQTASEATTPEEAPASIGSTPDMKRHSETTLRTSRHATQGQAP